MIEYGIITGVDADVLSVDVDVDGDVLDGLPYVGLPPRIGDGAVVLADGMRRVVMVASERQVSTDPTADLAEILGATHEHPIAEVLGLQEALDGTIDYIDSHLRAFAGGISLVGSYDATAHAVVALVKGIPTGAGLSVGKPLPVASATNKGMYLIITVPGVATPADHVLPNGTDLHVGDWVVSDGQEWLAVDMSASAKEVYYQPDQPTDDEGFVTGQLWIDGDQVAHVKASPTEVLPVFAAPTAHGHQMEEVVGLADAIAGAVADHETAKPHVALTGGLPAALGTPAVGSAVTSARADHVHKMPTAGDVGAAAAVHGHAQSDITGLVQALTDIDTRLDAVGPGIPGEPGSRWWWGSGAPSGLTQARPGDMYLDTTSGRVYALSATGWAASPQTAPASDGRIISMV